MADDELAETTGFMLGESSIKPEWTAEGTVLIQVDSALTAALDKIRLERDEALAALAEHRAHGATYGPNGTHPYLSWGCWHAVQDGQPDMHDYCQNKDGQAGPKIPARCKWCPSPCSCSCHDVEPGVSGG